MEHNTYCALIIDLGLARFQKQGLCFGMEGGNLYYAAPEILQGKYRDQYSDVWAMGKIIAELLIVPRIRLPPTLTSAYVFSAVSFNPYSFLVSRMVSSYVIWRPKMNQVLPYLVDAGQRWIWHSALPLPLF